MNIILAQNDQTPFINFVKSTFPAFEDAEVVDHIKPHMAQNREIFALAGVTKAYVGTFAKDVHELFLNDLPKEYRNRTTPIPQDVFTKHLGPVRVFEIKNLNEDTLLELEAKDCKVLVVADEADREEIKEFLLTERIFNADTISKVEFCKHTELSVPIVEGKIVVSFANKLRHFISQHAEGVIELLLKKNIGPEYALADRISDINMYKVTLTNMIVSHCADKRRN